MACSNADSRAIMEGYFAVVQMAQKKTRDYQRLLADFQNLIEAYDKSRKLTRMEGEKVVRLEIQLRQSEQSQRDLQQKYDEKEHEMRTMEAQLKDARKMVGSRLGYIRALEADRDELESRLKLVKENLKMQLICLPAENQERLAFMHEPRIYRSESREYAERERSMLPRIESETEESIDYDDTSREQSRLEVDDERTPVRAMKRRTPPSRRALFTAPHPPLIRVPPPASDKRVDRISGVRKSIARRRSSIMGHIKKTPAMDKTTVKTSVQFDEAGGLKQVKTTVAVDTKSSTPNRKSRNWTGGQPIDRRAHRFIKYTGMAKKCVICDMGFGFLRGKPGMGCTDCSVYVHEKCEEKLRVFCLPQSHTPRARMAKSSRLPMTPLASSTKQRLKPPLHEFCLPTAPMLPVPVVRCVIALEQIWNGESRMKQQGLYRTSGNVKMVAKLLEELCEMKDVPRLLSHQETDVLAGCIKAFLRNLRDPLIPKSSRREFVLAATTENEEEREKQLRKAIEDLPQPHRDTLAYLCVHWHKVILWSDHNRMTLDALATCLAPTVIGLKMDSEEHRSCTSMVAAGYDAKHATEVLKALLSMETKYWSDFISFDDLNHSLGTLSRGSNQNTNMNVPRVEKIGWRN